MTPTDRQTIVHARTHEFNNIMRTTLFAFLGIGAALHFGPDAFSAPLFALTIVVTGFGILAGNAALDDLAKLQDDMTDEFAATSYGQGVTARDFGRFKMVSSGLLAALAVATLAAMVV